MYVYSVFDTLFSSLLQYLLLIVGNFGEVYNLAIWRIQYGSPNELNACVPMAVSIQISPNLNLANIYGEPFRQIYPVCGLMVF